MAQLSTSTRAREEAMAGSAMAGSDALSAAYVPRFSALNSQMKLLQSGRGYQPFKIYTAPLSTYLLVYPSSNNVS